jgi:hypothetical protein
VANVDEVKPMLLSAADVQPGDVLLCNCGFYSEFSQRRIEDATGSPYVHAAIFVGDDKVAESTTGGLQQVSLAELLKRYAHVAVFRSSYVWSDDRVRKLNAFAEREIQRQAKYSFIGAFKLLWKPKKHAATIHQQLQEFFNRAPESKKKLVFFGRKRYFCSEFVAQCFIEAGFTEGAGAVFFRPDVQTPAALGKDWLYGVLVGFITDKKDYVVPVEDEFYNDATYREIFLDEAEE